MKHPTAAPGRSFSRAARSARRRFSSSASCASSSRLSAVSRAVSPRRLVARQRGKRRELCGTAMHRHLRMVPRDVVRQIDDVGVGRLHFITFSKRKKYSPPGVSQVSSRGSGWCGLKNSTMWKFKSRATEFFSATWLGKLKNFIILDY